MNYIRNLTLCLAILTATVFSGCVTLQEVGHGSKELVFNVPPAVKFDSSIQTIAVLRGKTDESGTLAARLAEELQRLQLKIMDTDALSQVSMERKLTVNRNSVTKYGDLVNVDLFFVVEWVTSSQAAFKLIEKDGRISYATFVYGNSDGKIIENVVKRLNGYTERYTLETGLTFTPGDANKDKIASMYTIGNLAGAERELQNALDSGSLKDDFTKVAYEMNLAGVRAEMGKYDEAIENVDTARRINDGISKFTTKIQPEFFLKYKEKLLKIKWAQVNMDGSSKGLAKYNPEKPEIAVLEFDTASLYNSYPGWRAREYMTVKLARANFNVYDRQYFAEIIGIQSASRGKMKEGEYGKLLGVSKLAYGKFLKRTKPDIRPVMKTVTKQVSVYDSNGKYAGSRPVNEDVLDRTLITFALEIQGRVTDAKTSASLGMHTVRKNPEVEEFPTGSPIPRMPPGFLEDEWDVKLYEELATWAERKLM